MTTTSQDTQQAAGAAAPGLTINGTTAGLDGVTPHTTLLDWLRERGLTGTKEGCAEGECGACAVLVARSTIRDTGSGQGGERSGSGPPADGQPATEWVAVNACLVPVAALDGQEVVTSEGLGTPEHLHPVQRELAVRGGSQCGYCTPGFVCAMAAEYYRADRTEFDTHALSGNLCRCTGYRPILDAARALGTPTEDDPLAGRRGIPSPVARHTRVIADGAELVRPADLAEAVGLLAAREDALPVAGSTDVGVEITIRGSRPPLLVVVDRLPELRGLDVDAARIRIGAALTLSEIERALGGAVPLLDELLPQFASRLIRNAATLGGNLGTASPIGDAAPALLALEASLVLVGPRGERTVALADHFTGYRQTVRARDELIKEVAVPLPLARTTAFHKIAKRRFDDISSVAVAFALDVVDGSVARARIGLGGVAATPVRARRTEAELEGRTWTAQTVRAAAAVLGTEGTPMSDHRASDRYRRAVLEQSLLKLHAATLEEEARR
ncbi:xanthine dehydrogenase small subunit [Ornithinimicrobium avium]|uniref:Xanthine dehydrogenase small subunit n=1 Tax=Ornithinimicrobium avium TaxID=2283195 RepID=A0A345NRV0_9MICO|nr:FAD binding domain-containing protein [Ornithinimicrobium avium]AXH97758.1 xanthine dehydrogenase small subunit [Ornithinimicrobium avium]